MAGYDPVVGPASMFGPQYNPSPVPLHITDTTGVQTAPIPALIPSTGSQGQAQGQGDNGPQLPISNNGPQLPIVNTNPTHAVQLPNKSYAQFLPHLANAGYTPDQIQSIIGQYHAQTTKQQAISKLPTDLQNLLTTYDAQQQPAQPANQSLFNPLAMQMFFGQTIAPYLRNISDQMRQTGKDMAGSIDVNSLPAPYRNIMNQSIVSRQAGMNNLANAYEGATVAQPFLDQLNKQLSAAESAQNYDRYTRERALAYQMYGGLGGLAGMGGGTTGAGAGVAAGAVGVYGGGQSAPAQGPTPAQIQAIGNIVGGSPLYPNQ